MKSRLFLPVLIGALWLNSAAGQETLEHNRQYAGAQAEAKVYKAIYQLDNASPAIINKTIRNINNLLGDPRLKDRLQIELVAFSGGTDAYFKNSEYGQAIKDLASKGIIVAQCLNTLKERNINKSELYDFLAYVPSGNGELVIRSNEGWTIIKP